MKAEEDIPRGEQVYDSYGVKDDSTFVINYGFLPPTRENKALVVVYMDPNDEHVTEKTQLLKILGLG